MLKAARAGSVRVAYSMFLVQNDFSACIRSVQLCLFIKKGFVSEVQEEDDGQ